MIEYRDGKFITAAAPAPPTGEGVFTTLRLYRGAPVDLPAHQARLSAHAAALGLAPVAGTEVLAGLIRALVAHNRLTDEDSRLRIVHHAEDGLRLTPGPLPARLADWRRYGMPVLTLDHTHRRTVDPALKTLAGLAGPRTLSAAADAGCPEAVILDEAGHLLEGIYSNVFLVRDGALSTPAAEASILAGRTRAVLLTLARRHGLPARETRLTADHLAGAEEIFLVNAVREVVPVTSVDGRTVGPGPPGPVTRTCQSLYREHIRHLTSRI